MGGAQAVTILTAFIRSKVIALSPMGAAGIGLMGVLTSFNGNVASIAGWGLPISGVRIISGAKECDRAAKAAAVRKLGRNLAWLGALASALLILPTCWATFGSAKYGPELAVASLSVPFMVCSGGWAAILQGMGLLRPLAKSQIAGALGGVAVGVPLIFVFGTMGLAISILLASAIPALILWISLQRIRLPAVGADEASIRTLLGLGAALMAAGFFGQLSTYAVRMIVIRSHGLDAAGYYQASNALAGALPAFIFTAMGGDFFPMVSGAKDDLEAKKITERQIRAGILMALPVLVSMITMGNVALGLLYSNDFLPAHPLLKWMIWGVFLRVFTWPLGFWLLGRGSANSVALSEGIANLVSALLPLALMPVMGLAGAAAAFFAANLFYAFLICYILHRKTRLMISAETAISFLLAAFALGLSQWLAGIFEGFLVGLTISFVVTCACVLIYRSEIHQDSLED